MFTNVIRYKDGNVRVNMLGGDRLERLCEMRQALGDELISEDDFRIDEFIGPVIDYLDAMTGMRLTVTERALCDFLGGKHDLYFHKEVA